MRKLTYYVAASLDGFIAGPDGDLSFFALEGDHLTALNEQHPETVPTAWREQAGIDEPNKVFDTVLMGRGTYEMGIKTGTSSPYRHLRQYVFSTGYSGALGEGVELVRTDPIAKVRELKREDGGLGIWLCGGGGLAGSLLPEIDELMIKLNPVVAGSGIPLFNRDFAAAQFRLTSHDVYDSGVAVMTYERR